MLPIPIDVSIEPPAKAALAKQSRYSSAPWKPDEIPTRQGTLRAIHGPLDAKTQPWGEFMGIQKPTNRGKGWKEKI